MEEEQVENLTEKSRQKERGGEHTARRKCNNETKNKLKKSSMNICIKMPP